MRIIYATEARFLVLSGDSRSAYGLDRKSERIVWSWRISSFGAIAVSVGVQGLSLCIE